MEGENNNFLEEHERIFEEWCEYLQEIIHASSSSSTSPFILSQTDETKILNILNLLTNLYNESQQLYFQSFSNHHQPFHPLISYSQHPHHQHLLSDSNQLLDRYHHIIGNYQFLFLHIIDQFYKSRNISSQITSLYFMTSLLGNSFDEESIKEDVDSLLQRMKSQNLLLSSLSARLAAIMAIQNKSFVDSLAGDLEMINLFINRLLVSHQHLLGRFNESNKHEIQIPLWDNFPHPPLNEINQHHPIFQYFKIPESLDDIAEWSLVKLEWVTCTSLSLLSCVADVIDVLGSLLSFNVLQITMDLMKLSSSIRAGLILRNGNLENDNTCLFPTLLLAGGHFLEKAFAHRKLSLEFIDRSGIELLTLLVSIPCASHLEVALSSCLYTLVSHPQVMEKIIRRKKDELKELYNLTLWYLTNSLTFSARENAVAILSVILPYRPSYHIFCSLNVMGHLFQFLRICLFSSPDTEDNSPLVGRDHSSSHGNTEVSLHLMCQSVKGIPPERINEIRDDILRVFLIYLRIGAFLDLELSSPESLSSMCGGSSNQPLPNLLSKYLGGNEEPPGLIIRRATSQTSCNDGNLNDGNFSLPPSHYTVITFDGEDTCSGAAESLLHAIREYVTNYNDLMKNPIDSRYPSEDRNDYHRDLLWCIPVKISSQNFRKDLGISQRKTDSVSHSVALCSPVKEVLKCGYLTFILYILQMESTIIHGNSSTIICLLQALELLCLNPTVIEQMCSTLTFYPTVFGDKISCAVDDELNDEMESLNGLSVVLDIACRGPKRDPLVKAHALHVLRSLVTPPEYTLLPPYIPLDDVEIYTSQTRSSRYSIGMSTPNPKFDRGFAPIGRVSTLATPGESDIGSLEQKHVPVDERPSSPTSTISSIRYIPISILIERAQKIARVVIRKCNGIHIIAAGLETPVTHYIYNICLAVIQILLGLAYDTHIRAILTRMDLEQQITSFWLTEKFNPHEAWSSPGAKCLKRLTALIRLCGQRLISLLSGPTTSHQFLFSRPSITASEALNLLLKHCDSLMVQHGSLENQMIAANTQIRFDQQELLLLVKDYLLEQGLAATAEMLTKESGMVDCPAPSKLPFSPPALAPPTNSSKKRNLSEVKSPTITSSKSRKVDINISNRVNTTISVPKVTASYHLPSIFDKFSHSSPRKSICKTPIKEKSTLPDLRSPPKGELSGSMNTNGVTLSGIINSYLRHQHQQCQHPVSIVPKFSLFEKHKCPAPPTSSNSLCDVLLQRRLFGDNIIRNKSHSFIDIHRLDQSRILRHRIFSEYRQWRIFQESQYDHISCAAFSCDSRKVWIGGSSPHADGMERGGSLRLFDLSSSQELGQWDFDHSIDSIISPSLSDSQILMTTTGHGAIVDYMPVVSYRTNIWRTSSHSQLVTDYFLDPVPLVDWEDFCRPVFNSQNTQVCGIPTQQINFISNSHAILKDVETGTNLLTFTRSSPSQSSLITVPYKIPNASFGLGSSGDNIVLADGILWDCRTGGVINDFDRLSHYGHGVFHPNGNCLLIDNFVWDMRKYSLLQTIKILDGGFKTHFSTDCNGTALFGYNSRSLEHLVNEEYIMNPLNLSQNCFYTLDSTDYSLIHTFELDSDGTSFWGPIQSDPVGLGYLLTCEVRFDNIRRSMYDVMRESCCRVLEIGRRKPGIQDSDMDDAQTIDDEDWEDDFGDEEAEEDDDILVDEEEDEEDGGFDEDSDHDDDSEDFDEVLEEEGTGDSDEEEYGDSDDEEDGDSDNERDGDSDNEEDGDSDDIDYLQTNTNLIN